MLLLNDSAILINWYGETPFLFCIPDENGGVCANIITYAALPEASPNKLNAWRFVKILLSDEVQAPMDADGMPGDGFPVGDPVRKESLGKTVDAYLNSWFPETADAADAYLRLADRLSDAVLFPPVVRKYVLNTMGEYVTSADGSNYDKLFAKLKSTLELYKDE